MTPLPSPLPIVPFARPVSGSVTLPGSKSLTNRALLLAALCDAPVTLTGALFSEDTELMGAALRALGLNIDTNKSTATIRVSAQENLFQSAIRNPQSAIQIDVGLAGTAARFLTALCAAAPGGVYRVDGVPRMRERPMRGLLDALRALGADIRCPGRENHFPIEIHARGLRGGAVDIDATESSQMLSALLMVSPLAGGPLDIRLAAPVREPFVRMTENLMEQFGLNSAGNRYRSPRTYAIEPDATAASYFLALPLVAGGSLALNDLRAPALDSLQGDIHFAAILPRLGLQLRETRDGLVASAPQPARQRPPGKQKTLTGNFSSYSDTFLTLAAIAPLLPAPTRITGIAHTRKQETDRVSGMAGELARLGQHVIETEDSLEIHPRPLREGQTIDTRNDHRFAMSFGILGCHDLHGDGRPWLAIANPECCAKTFPNFFELLENVRGKG